MLPRPPSPSKRSAISITLNRHPTLPSRTLHVRSSPQHTRETCLVHRPLKALILVSLKVTIRQCYNTLTLPLYLQSLWNYALLLVQNLLHPRLMFTSQSRLNHEDLSHRPSNPNARINGMKPIGI